MATEYTIGAGDGFVLEVEVLKENGDPEDLTGKTILFTAKKKLSESDEEAYITKDITTHTDAVNGESLIEVPKDETTVPGKYYFNTRFLDEAGDEYPQSTPDGILNIETRSTKRTEPLS